MRSATKSQQNVTNQRAFNVPVCVASISQQIRQVLAPYLMNVTPAYNTILVDYLPYRIQESELIQQLNTLITNIDFNTLNSQSKWVWFF